MLSLGHVAPRLKAKIEAAEAAAQEAASQFPALRTAGREELRQLHAVAPVREVSVDEYAGGSSRSSGSGR